ncbi:MAG: ribonuclease Y [Candidatus Aminicenantes bacterium]|nr:ribonuclease Y [Candidatus Aminicenantes bacterium]NIM77765.1 ribonuclease Y [Candidatus Aminicenantes bacterium]NIN17078.1 ribonuclease Y [Candidatus Aminicenantes bacterium]NIN40971.1 ribonuclease Y [Candidatus Aminicenantes bacterium]NIN83776.1 ribonuclease Y [Candidatus Aminicenantes bacterium]
MNIVLNIALTIIGIFIGFMFFLLFKNRILANEYEKINFLRKELEETSRNDLETRKKRLTADLKEEFVNWKNEYNRKQSSKVNRLNEMERRLIQREENLDRRYINLDNKEKEIKRRERELHLEEEELKALNTKLTTSYEEQKVLLEKISGMTVQEAKEMMIKQYESEARMESAQKLKTIEEELKEKSVMMAKEVIATSVQRIASEHTISSSVTVIDLPSDEMKGRIIGREGRNIRALETATEVDFIVDDTPEAIIVSSFDPIRREIAKRALETLINDGRIHPARVEEVVEKIKLNFDDHLKEVGENVVLELGISDIDPALFYYLGKLKYRTSYGQNVLEHSKEVAMIASLMARELGMNVAVAKRAGLLHDIGKSIDRETEGTHTELSVELTKKHNESQTVQEAIASHHMDVEFTSVEGVLIQAADTMSAARPGSRREIFETYIKRLEKLEELSKSFTGVKKAYALRAGREVRVIVNSNEMDDNRTFVMSKDIAKKIQEEMEYPGQIKVTVIREVRATEYAK